MAKKMREAGTLARMESILDAFMRSTGLSAVVVDQLGRTSVAPDRAEGLCCRAGASGEDPHCADAFASAAAVAAARGQPIRFRCPRGTAFWVAPIYGQAEAAGVVCTQVRGWTPDSTFWEQIEALTGIERADAQPLIEAAFALERVEPGRVQAAAEVLMAIANYLGGQVSLGEGVKTPREHLLHQHATRLMASMEGKGGLESMPDRILEREKQLLLRLRLLDVDGAELVLDDLLADIALDDTYGKARAQELVALMSRTAIEMGGDKERVLTVSAEQLESIRVAADAEELADAVRTALRAFVAARSPQALGARHELVRKVMAYLRENYHRQDLDLHTIAQVAHLSPAYLSHLFSREMGMTITQYLTSVRLENAKKLLRETNLSVQEVADEVGYATTGYFCKIFKKCLYTSPSAYREQFRVGPPQREDARVVELLR